MKKSIISLAIAAGLIASMPAQAGDVKVKWFGFAQITAKQGDGLDPSANKATGPAFGADRVRFGFKIKDGNVFGKLQADLNKATSQSVGLDLDNSTATGCDSVTYTDPNDINVYTCKGGINNKSGVLPEVIKDVYAGYKFSNAASIKAGQFKTPVGMDFNTSGKKLDITQRSMEKGLVLERAAGAMLSGRKIANGIGYDLFYGNVAGRSNAHANGTVADDASYAVRVMYDMGKMMHVEASYGVDASSGSSLKPNATGTALVATKYEDYEVFDVAFRMKMAAMTIKAEYIDGSNVKGVKDSNEKVWYAHFGYSLGKTTELLVRHYQADSSKVGKSGTSLTNTYLGANFFLGSNKTNGRIQVNYVLTGGDNYTKTGTNYNGKAAKGYTDDVILAQYQVSF